MSNTIKVLSPLQQMFLRPGYVIGSIETPDTLLKESIDNPSDELLNKFGDRIEIITNPKEGYYTVRDNGRGLPLDKFHTDNADMSYLNGDINAKIIFCREFSSGKYDKSLYPYSTGTNGLGTKAINVFSSKTHIRVRDVNNLHKGKVYELILGWDENRNQTYQENWLNPKTIKDFWWNTEVTFFPNPDVFRTLTAKVKDIPLKILKRSRPEVKITVNDKEIEAFSFTDTIENNLLKDKLFRTTLKYGSVLLDLSFAWSSKAFDSYYRGTVNLGTCNEGFHVNEAKRAIGRAVAKFNESVLSPTDAENGLRMFVDALVYDPMFTGQTKEKLSTIDDFKRHNTDVKEKYKHLITVDEKGRENLYELKKIAVKTGEWQDVTTFSDSITNEIYKLLKEDDDFINHLVSRLFEYKKSMQQLSDESYINSLIKTGSDKVSRSSVKGVVEATSTDRSKCELYLCEGRSAGSPIKSERDRNYQALFELRGKPMNVANDKNIKEIIENEEIKTIINAIGIGMHPYNIKMEDARYGKIILATDADADGLHIQGLIIGALTFLCPEVFSGGQDGQSMVYTAQAPLYKQDDKFVYSESDLDPGKPFKRFKGLGSMVPKDLGITVVNSKTRRLKRINLNQDRDRLLNIITSSTEKKRIMVENGLLKE